MDIGRFTHVPHGRFSHTAGQYDWGNHTIAPVAVKQPDENK